MDKSKTDPRLGRKQYDSDYDSTPPAVMAPKQVITFTLDGHEIK